MKQSSENIPSQASQSGDQSNQGNQGNQGNWWIVLAVVALAVLPLIFVKGEYGGADGEAKAAITEIQPDYKPWFSSLIELPSGEVESLLFASQAAVGAGIIGYVIGLYKGRKEEREERGEKEGGRSEGRSSSDSQL